MRIGITGQAGFVGTHLYNYLGLQPGVTRIPFADEFFSSDADLRRFVSQCDVIVHFAAMNRHNDPDVLYRTNIRLVEQLIDALETEGAAPHVLFSSSIQEQRDNPYGRSKKIGREKLLEWAERNGAKFAGLVIPNVYGPFGHPYYNSVVATFSHQLTHNEEPRLERDGDLRLIYVGELVREIWRMIEHGTHGPALHLDHTAECSVSGLLDKLQSFRDLYYAGGVFPSLDNRFELNLFNTFRCYIDQERHFPFKLKKHADERGAFVETVRTRTGGQFSFSTTKPGVTRGEHYHTRKIERFAVMQGKALIQMRRIGTGKVLEFRLDGREPAFVDMPVWHTHNITNTGTGDLYTAFWISEFYDPADPDTFPEKVLAE